LPDITIQDFIVQIIGSTGRVGHVGENCSFIEHNTITGEVDGEDRSCKKITYSWLKVAVPDNNVIRNMRNDSHFGFLSPSIRCTAAQVPKRGWHKALWVNQYIGQSVEWEERDNIPQ
jgi:hypothetical protein